MVTQQVIPQIQAAIEINASINNSEVELLEQLELMKSVVINDYIIVYCL